MGGLILAKAFYKGSNLGEGEEGEKVRKRKYPRKEVEVFSRVHPSLTPFSADQGTSIKKIAASHRVLEFHMIRKLTFVVLSTARSPPCMPIFSLDTWRAIALLSFGVFLSSDFSCTSHTTRTDVRLMLSTALLWLLTQYDSHLQIPAIGRRTNLTFSGGFLKILIFSLCPASLLAGHMWHFTCLFSSEAFLFLFT